MKLSEWMKSTGIKDADLAGMVNRERSTVTRWRLERTRPDFNAIHALEKATDGKVTWKDFLQVGESA